MFLPATLFIGEEPRPNSVRVIGAMPAIYLLAGLGVWETARFLKKRLLAVTDIKYAGVVGAVLGSMILVQGAFTYVTYFHYWANVPQLFNEYEVEWSYLANI